MNRRKERLGASEKNALKGEIMSVLSEHVGRERAIGMGELYEKVFNELWQNRINDTRRLRQLITELRRKGKPICSASTSEGGGYYLPAVGQELDQYCQRRRMKALKELSIEAKIRKISLPELLGQMALSMSGGKHENQR